jgi:hypothetical protein
MHNIEAPCSIHFQVLVRVALGDSGAKKAISEVRESRYNWKPELASIIDENWKRSTKTSNRFQDD